MNLLPVCIIVFDVVVVVNKVDIHEVHELLIIVNIIRPTCRWSVVFLWNLGGCLP